VRLLILGGTLFLGRHIVESALARGHDVATFTRGETNPDLFAGIVERLRGDRDGDLSALAGRRWDAVVDTSGYVPRVVGASASLLAHGADHYTFVSSGSVYADVSREGVDEQAVVEELPEDADEDVERHYGALKAACERAAHHAFPGRALIVRAGLIVGPHDPTSRFTYWVTRLARGGDVLAPEPQHQPVQLIDARDLADWLVRTAEERTAGVFNATGPAGWLTMADLLEGVRAATGGRARLVWVDEPFLLDHGVEPWTQLPLWLAPGEDPLHRGFLAVDVSRALAAGLEFRALEATVRDTLAWARGEPAAMQSSGISLPPGGLSSAREAELLAAWRATRTDA
jgi:2'-hydroxyisoflavone reductase